jgi:DNA helicase HerA-like ATPase
MAEIDVPAAVRAGYAFSGPSLELGALVVGETCDPTAKVRIPLAMVNRHGLVAGATGTGKTKTLQTMAEQLSASGVPVFLADIKGDLSGMAAPGEASDRVTTRAKDIGYDWAPAAYPVEFFALGGRGKGVPVRATVTSFGPTLLAKVLGLNDVQESSLGLVFHFADKNALPVLDLADLRAVIQHLTSPAGAAELAELGGLSKATAGVILRKLIAFADAGAEDFFGETEFDTRDFLRTTPDGRGLVSILELPGLQDQPQLFATFLMWFLADLFDDLPEVGDVEKPKLVFFFDEAHLLFRDAAKDFLTAITQTVRLIRSKGVGVFFVTQTPKDVPGDVLAQLGNRVQHALRAYTPEDAKALKATVSTFPKSGYDLEEVLTQLGTGEAVITVLSERGAPSPVAWTRLPPPRSLMAQVDAAVADGIVAASPLSARYGPRVDRESAYEMLLANVAVPSPAPAPAPAPAPQADRADQADQPKARPEKSFLEKALGNATVRSALRSAATAAGREIARSIFGTARRRR